MTQEEKPPDRIINVKVASMRTGLTRNRIRLICDNGYVRHFKLGNRRKISMRSLDEYMEMLFDGTAVLPEFPYNVKKREKMRRARARESEAEDEYEGLD